jgi:hypothetical protein
MTLIIFLVLVLSYVISILAALMVLPLIWLPTGIILTIFGGILFYKYRLHNAGLISIAIFTNGVFISLGQYLEYYVPAISIPVNIFGSVFTFPIMLIFYYWKEGQRRVEIRVKQEKLIEEELPKFNAWDKFRLFLKLRKRKKQIAKSKGIGNILAWQYAYVEYKEEIEKQDELNSLDFILGKEVILQRNEYDQNQIK